MAQPISVRLADGNQANIDQLAQLMKRSRSFIINEAVEAYLKERIPYLEELKEAVANAGSGHGHSGNQIHSWMKSWGTESELSAPEPDIKPNS